MYKALQNVNYYFLFCSYCIQIIHLLTKCLSNAYYEMDTVLNVAETTVNKIVKKLLPLWSLITSRGKTTDNKQNK